MAEEQQKMPVVLPGELRQQFARLEQRLWRAETASAICFTLAGIAGSWLALFVSDRLWNSPVWLRVFLLLCGVITGLAAAAQWSRKWIFQRRDTRELANLVQRKFQRLGDRLLGIVELAGEEHHSRYFSPALYQAAILQVAEQAKDYDFAQSVDTRTVRALSWFAGPLLGVAVLGFFIFPEASRNAWARWLAPTSTVERYTLVRLQALPSACVVPHGESFAISGSVVYKSFWKPAVVTAQLRHQVLRAIAQNGNFSITLPGQVEPGMVEFSVGDARQNIPITPKHRPSLKELTAHITLPEYLRHPTEQVEPIQNGSLLALEGSTISFLGKISRELTEAQIQTAAAPSAAQLQIQDDQFASHAVPVKSLSQYTFHWKDTLGLTNAAPLHLSVQAQKDGPPVPELPELPRESAMLAQDVLRLSVEARDDYGVRDYGLTWEFDNDEDPSATGASASTEVKVLARTPQEKKATHTFQWSPSIFRIPTGAIVELHGYARDYFPERERALTAIHRVHIMGPEQHAEMLRQRLEAVLARSEEVTRLQEKIVADTRDVKESEKLAEAQKNARIGQTKDNQSQNAQQLEQLAKQGEQSLREAMKNPVFTEEMLREWSKTMQQWQKLAQQTMKQAAQKMQSAQQNPGSRAQDLAEAQEKAEEALQQLQRLQNKSNQDMDQLQALTLSQRLRQAGTQEVEISERLQKHIADLIGLLPEELPSALKQLETGLIKQQTAVQSEADALQRELSRFFERTQKTNYNEVFKEMKTAQTVEELERVAGMIGDNIAMESSRLLTNWAQQFQKWSEKLDAGKETPNGNSGGGQGGESSKKMDMTKQLIALLRVREREMALRQQTSLLEEQKNDGASYQEQAAFLYLTQKSLSQELGRIQEESPIPNLQPTFRETATAMKKVESFLQKPRTDKEVNDAEVQTIELLTDLINLINEQAQRPNPQQTAGASPEEMEFFLKMMQGGEGGDPKGMAAKPATGAHTAGGSTDRAGNFKLGNAQGKNAGARNTSKASGSTQTTPTEFREALENYFHGVEENSN